MGIKYRVGLARNAEREFLSLPWQIQERIRKAIDLLQDNPRPSGVRKMENESNFYRIRTGDYRVVYAVDDTERTVDIVRVRHRKEAYR